MFICNQQPYFELGLPKIIYVREVEATVQPDEEYEYMSFEKQLSYTKTGLLCPISLWWV